MPPLRIIAPLLAVVGLAGTTPQVVHRGEPARITLKPTTINNCLAHVQFADDSGVNLPIKYPDGSGRVSWTYRVPEKAPLGLAHWSVRCGVLYETGGAWLIVPAGVTVGPRPPRPVVSKQGFSVRPDEFGTGNTASYGLLIRNPARKDAHRVSVTVSFISAAGSVTGRKTTMLARIGAGETFALGGSTELSSQGGVSRLVASIRVGSYTAPANELRPRVVTAKIVASDADPGWVGEVDGEIVNDASRMTLSRATIFVVLLDANARIVGGGTGASSSALASGGRGPFAARLGFSAVSTAQASRPVISVVPTYR